MREDFEATCVSLIEVHLYHRSSYSAGRNDNVSIIDFKAINGFSGVALK